MAPGNLNKMMIFMFIGMLLASVAALTALEAAGASSGNIIVSGEVTSTLTGGITVTYSSAQGQGGSGGGGGGGLSGENFTNIESNEKYYLYISKDKITSYGFTSSDPVLFVNITGNTSPGEIRTSVEVLRDTSTLVKEPAPGMIYKNANIWVGTSGFAVPRNIKEAVIRFRVENAWIRSNGFSQSDMKMYRWGGTSWFELETNVKGTDEIYSYFESNTVSFSSIAISGMKSAQVITTSNPQAGIATMTAIAQSSGTERIEKSPGFEAAIIIIAICAVYLTGCRKN